jgi:hypothetical protein
MGCFIKSGEYADAEKYGNAEFMLEGVNTSSIATAGRGDYNSSRSSRPCVGRKRA